MVASNAIVLALGVDPGLDLRRLLAGVVLFAQSLVAPSWIGLIFIIYYY